MSSISVRHNIEVAHRLSELEGKCQNIHGHSMLVTMTLYGVVDNQGLLGGLDYGEVKYHFRKYLDTYYDHHLLLNKNDPWSGPLLHSMGHSLTTVEPETGTLASLPGLICFDGDPTTERIAGAIHNVMWDNMQHNKLITNMAVEVWETAVNKATYP